MVEAKSKRSTSAANEDERLGGEKNSGSPVDPNTGEPQEESRGPAGVPDDQAEVKNAGAENVSDHFAVTVNPSGFYEVRPKGWIGDDILKVAPSRIDDLISALQGARKAKAPKAGEEFELVKTPEGQVVAEEKTPHAS